MTLRVQPVQQQWPLALPGAEAVLHAPPPGGSSTSAGGSSSSTGGCSTGSRSTGSSSSNGSSSNRHLLYKRDPTHSLPFMALITAVFGYRAEIRVPLWRGAAAPRLQTIRNIVGGAAWDALVLAYRDDICVRRNATKATVWNLAVTAGGEPSAPRGRSSCC